MSIDILESINGMFGGTTVRQVSGFLGESETDTRSAARSVFPGLLAALMHKSTTANGAADIFQSVTSGAVDSGIGGKLPSILGNRGSLDSLLAGGEQLTGSVLGNRTGGVAHAISQVAGIKPGSAMSLLSMGAPLLLGLLKRQVTQGSLDAGGLVNLLLGQRSSLERAGLDDRISSALGFGSLPSLLGSLPAARERTERTAGLGHTVPLTKTAEPRGGMRWLPWALAAGVAALVFWGVANRMDRSRAPNVAATQSDASQRTRLASLPANIYFETGQSQVGAEGQRTASDIAGLVRQQGGPIAVTGYTDRSGSPDQNLELAKDRATAVKDALVAEGVPESDIVMRPPAFVTGTGSDAEARRVEIAPAQ